MQNVYVQVIVFILHKVFVIKKFPKCKHFDEPNDK